MERHRKFFFKKNYYYILFNVNSINIIATKILYFVCIVEAICEITLCIKKKYAALR